MPVPPKPGLERFLADCGASLPVDKVAENRLHAASTQQLRDIGDAARATQLRNAMQIGELVGLFVSPEFGTGGSDVDSVRRVSLDEFKRRIGGNPRSFVLFLLPAAKYIEKNYRIPGIVALAQAAHETGWGAPAGVKTYNLWNLRADSAWVKSGKAYYDTGSNGKFRNYNNFMEAIVDYALNTIRGVGDPKVTGYYEGAVIRYRAGGTPEQFIRDIAGTYAPISDGNNDYAGGVLRRMAEIRSIAPEL